MFNGLGFRAWRFCRRWMVRQCSALVSRIPYFRFIRETADSQVPITFGMWWRQAVLGQPDGVYWPVHPSSVVNGYQNVLIGEHTSPGYSPGCYIQGIGRVYIGDYTQLAQNVGIISANHDVHDNSVHQVSEVRIGRYCWIGMNAVVLPGVVLGDFTVVGAGSVVTKPFPEGYCVIAGNPARVIRRLDPAQCVPHTCRHAYVGFFRKERFEAYRRANLRL
jgi:acetyltransferase-like isoleucine patch superfamily enzyme